MRAAADEGARVVCLPELTRLPYVAVERRDAEHPQAAPEPLPGGPTYELVAPMRAEYRRVRARFVYEAADDGGLGYNTAFVVAPDGAIVARTREDASADHRGLLRGHVVPHRRLRMAGHDHRDGDVRIPHLLGPVVPRDVARLHDLRCRDARLPDRDRSEPDHPAFDTEPLWEQVIRAQGIMNGTFMIAVNRRVPRARLRSTGRHSSAIRTAGYWCRRPRSEAAVLVADLDLDQRRDWLELFPLLRTRRAETYGPLTQPT